MRKFNVGDLVVYRKPKRSTNPSPRAKDIHAAPHGEDYAYMIEKYWSVAEVRDDDTIVVSTRRGKRHQLRIDDPLLRKANLLDMIFRRSRFPQLASAT